jgi:hypothetical protein
MNQWKAFVKKTGLDVGGLSLTEVVVQLKKFLMPISIAAADKTESNLSWPKGGPWPK